MPLAPNPCCRCISCVTRGKHFNVAARVHGPQRSVDSMTVMQLWEVKNEAGNRALHSQLISSLFEKPPSLSVQVGGGFPFGLRVLRGRGCG